MKSCFERMIIFAASLFTVFSGEQVMAVYCPASGGCDEYIYEVQVGAINNSGTLCSGYADYTSTHSTTMEPETAYPITIVTAVDGVPYVGYPGDQLGIWVDWNGDEDFSDAGETVYTASDYGYFTTNITPPAGTTPGNKRMRIRLMYMGTLSPCGAVDFGEVEDYTITIPDNQGCSTITVGAGTAAWAYPMYTYYHDSRTQVIYLASEIGRAGIVNSIGLNVAVVPGQPLNNWTIRMKHTTKSTYSTASLESAGWTVVYQGNEPVGTTGWRMFNLTTPFAYNGSDNLMVDFSHNNSSYSTQGWCLSSAPGGTRSAYAYSDSANGDPLSWSGTSSPTVYGTSSIPNLKLIICSNSSVNISGYIKTAQGVAIKGVNVSASTGETAVTDTLGYYKLAVDQSFSGTVTPSQTDWTFNPPWRSYSNPATDQNDQDFTCTYGVSYGGSGTISSPYLIYNAAQLNGIGARSGEWSKYFKLMADIDLSGYDGKAGRPSFNVIGSFSGVFDGDSHTISNFTYDSDAGDRSVGMFSYVSSVAAQIKNVKLINVNVNSISWLGTGGLIGEIDRATVSGCSVQGGNVTSTEGSVGGLCGMAWTGTISNCSADAVNVISNDIWAGGLLGTTGTKVIVSDSSASCTVSAKQECGGLIGSIGGSGCTIIRCSSGGNVSVNYTQTADRTAGGLIGSNSGTVDSCYSTAAVTGNGAGEIGGLVGRNMRNILNSYASGSVSGYGETGGLVGLNWKTPSTTGSITNCYSTGVSNGAGLIGYNIDGVITSSYWDKQTSGQTWSDGGTGKTTAEMKTQATFAGWDFTGSTADGFLDIWHITANNYPRLSWASGTKYGGGTGDANDPYLIYTASQLVQVGTQPADWGKYFKLMADIDLSAFDSNSFSIIGTYEQPFTGSFDGANHAIRNFHRVNTRNYAGFFEYIDSPSAVIKNLGIVDSSIDAGDNGTGMIIGVLKNGTITNCWTDNCTVAGTFYVGGIVGYSYGTVSACCAKRGAVSGEFQIIGGLIGQNEGTVTNCYSQCDVTAAHSYAGGIVCDNRGTISKCYAAGTVTGGSQRAGIAWFNTGTIADSYWDTTISVIFYSNGGTGKTTTQMKTPSTFVGWDFVGEAANGKYDIWRLCSSGSEYPRLNGQYLPPDVACPDGVDFLDYTMLASAWLYIETDPKWCPPCDLTHDGKTDFADLFTFCSSWLAGK